jgi:hypothetical protein
MRFFCDVRADALREFDLILVADERTPTSAKIESIRRYLDGAVELIDLHTDKGTITVVPTQKLTTQIAV